MKLIAITDINGVEFLINIAHIIRVTRMNFGGIELTLSNSDKILINTDLAKFYDHLKAAPIISINN